MDRPPPTAPTHLLANCKCRPSVQGPNPAQVTHGRGPSPSATPSITASTHFCFHFLHYDKTPLLPFLPKIPVAPRALVSCRSWLLAQAPSASVKLAGCKKVPADEYRRQFFGVPWPRGAGEKPDKTLRRSLAADGKTTAAYKTWPLAYWPDGSGQVGAGLATVAGAVGPLTVAPGSSVFTDGPAIQVHAKPPMRSKSITWQTEGPHFEAGPPFPDRLLVHRRP